MAMAKLITTHREIELSRTDMRLLSEAMDCLIDRVNEEMEKNYHAGHTVLLRRCEQLRASTRLIGPEQ